MLQSARQVTCGLYRQHCNGQFEDADLKSEEDLLVEAIGDMQAGHSTRVSWDHYAVELPTYGAMSERAWRAYLLVRSCDI
jgi:hypothetical protein